MRRHLAQVRWIIEEPIPYMHVLYNVIGATDVTLFLILLMSVSLKPLVVSAWMLYLRTPSLIPHTIMSV